MRREYGVSLIEILISVCIFSIGLLAFAKAQVLTLSYDNQAYFTSVAVVRLQSMAERLRADASHLRQTSNAWNKLNAKLLPQGRGKVLGSNPYIISIHWSQENKTKKLSLTIFKE